MAIAFRDFDRKMTKSGSLSQEREPLSATVARANAWISSSAVLVINVETVVMPAIKGDYLYTPSMRSSGFGMRIARYLLKLQHE
jgi:hypothetical protein